MKLKTLESIDLKGKTVLYRAPYDIELKNEGGGLVVADDMRISATLPTLEYLIKENCRIVILTYVGRPDGKIVEELRTTPHAKCLAGLLGRKIEKVDECIGVGVEEKIKNMQGGDILMLENVRFYSGEMIDDDEFAKELCKGKDLIVFDGFPQAHRKHASTTGIERHLPVVAGFYLEKEYRALSSILIEPKRPFTVIVGGAKISDKIDAINNLLNLADKVLVGGAVANVFLKAQGFELGNSFVEDVFVDKSKREKQDWVLYAKNILEKFREKIILPVDLVVSNGSTKKIVFLFEEKISSGFSAFDIGPRTQGIFSEIIQSSRLVFWAGPLGKFEDPDFAEGSKATLLSVTEVKENKNATAVLAGGDTIDMIRRYGNMSDYTYVSLAGGATLDFLAGKTLPALVPLIIN